MNAAELPAILNLVIAGKWNLVNLFGGIFQNGFRVACRTGVALESLLTDDFGVDPVYLESVSTIFLNGSCVDDLRAAIVRDGDILALSSAMPGLVGASLRRGGALAALRSGITLARRSAEGLPSRGMITVKLFNIVMAELGPAFLQRGVIVQRERLLQTLSASPQAFPERCDEASIDGRAVPPSGLAGEVGAAGDSLVFLKVLIPK